MYLSRRARSSESCFALQTSASPEEYVKVENAARLLEPSKQLARTIPPIVWAMRENELTGLRPFELSAVALVVAWLGGFAGPQVLPQPPPVVMIAWSPSIERTTVNGQEEVVELCVS